ncbi:hypothetical protein PMI09_02198 [Rhizobium sp. CF122]|uniref:hypothetical protein n=1 Tax=Rhizobium sp. CF122 TaxID=1144312 RepID=UPI000271D33D|nr:hypothetical protein [Rhizobium sp. CF122]EJL54882.1 hypothetical protein PMI09_02198 [Rhizobium sp. CF122]
MIDNFVSTGWTSRGHWVAIRENDITELLGPYPTAAEAQRVAAEESDRLGLRGMYRGVRMI